MTTEAEFKRIEEYWERKQREWEEEYEAYCGEQDDGEEYDYTEEYDTEEYDEYDFDVDKYLDKGHL